MRIITKETGTIKDKCWIYYEGLETNTKYVCAMIPKDMFKHNDTVIVQWSDKEKPVKMTVDEISEALGYKVKVVI